MTTDADMTGDEDLEALRRRFEADPADLEVCIDLGVAYVDRDELKEARAVFERGLKANPNPQGKAVGARGVAKRRLAELPERFAEEIIEPALNALDGSERATCLWFIAASIRAIDGIDPHALAVAESPRGFNVWGGMGLACEPNGRLFYIKLHEEGTRGLVDRIEAAGGREAKAAKKAMPRQVWVAVPVERLEDFRDELMEGHRRHLEDAIQPKKNPQVPRRHRVDLCRYVLDEADKASAP